MLNRTRTLVLTLSFPMLTLLATSISVATEANRHYVTLQNDSGIVFAEVQVSSIKDRTWKPDLLGNNVLRSGGWSIVTVPEGKWDFKFVDGAGDSCIIHDVIVNGDVTWDLTPGWLAKYCVLRTN